ncbi:N-formylglutamate amidohydrolase [Nocardia jiangxiensis]|uniref:N-formylglutamate amidohydrolase n=1 Tax=Nocardia jiangxiensis TaxID=282685 RepID=A0ABW6S1Y8_9NOCA|nr:N-formylglutamate amidohydrolase [Nocardia jiangxiensis]
MQYTVIPGAADSPVLIHVPHDSRMIPAQVRTHIPLDDVELSAELSRMTDAHTAMLAEQSAARAEVRPWLFVNELSRLVVDPERFPDEREEMRAVGMGAVYTRTSHGARLRRDDPEHEKALLARYYEPYAAAMTRAVESRVSATDRAIIVDLHSYPSVALPYELHGAGPRPQVCLGADSFHTPARLLAAARNAFADFEVEVNSPFSGTYVPLRHYGRNPDVSALMVEIRRDTYMVEPGGDPHAGSSVLVSALAGLLDEISWAAS